MKRIEIVEYATNEVVQTIQLTGTEDPETVLRDLSPTMNDDTYFARVMGTE